MNKNYDSIIIGAGHNGLVASIFLARAGQKVLVVEQKDTVGGATKTEYPFKKAPNLGTSSGAYLLGLMPPELIQKLNVNIPTLRRDPHYFLPTQDNRYLLFGSDKARMEKQFKEFFSIEDWEANERLNKELDMLRVDVAPTWLKTPGSIEETAEKYIRPELKEIFVNLCRGSVGDYLNRFGFKSDLLKAMYAVTDGFSGLFGTWDTPGTGMNFLVHNMCRLPEADGTWMVVKGGMGTVSGTLAEEAKKSGVEFLLSKEVKNILLSNRKASGIAFSNGDEVKSKRIIVNADPFTMRELIGKDNLPESYNKQLDDYIMPGSTMKVNLALKDLPKFTCLSENLGQHNTTIHLLPSEDRVISELKIAFEDVKAGKLPEFPSIEWYIHTTVDPSLQDENGYHNSALFVQWVPYEISGSSWEVEEEKYVKHLLSICDKFAPGTSDLVVDTFPLHPKKIESHFGIKYGHIHHIDNGFGFNDRLNYKTPIDGLFSCSAGCHPAGSVIGAAGHNAAQVIISGC